MNGAIPSFCTVDLLLGGKPLEEEKRPKTGDNLPLEKTGERVQNDKSGLFKKENLLWKFGRCEEGIHKYIIF